MVPLLLLLTRLASLASSETVATGPGGVHLSLGRSSGSFVVTWQTALLPASVPALLHYGLHPEALNVNVTATSTVLANNEATKGPPLWRNISIHKAPIVGVDYGQTVFYQVSGSTNNQTILNFTNWVPSPGARSDRPFTFAVFGDLAVKEQGK